jgi:hypothetical protein
MRGWLKVQVGGLRGLEWHDGSHLPTLFVVLEMEGQVFRTRYLTRTSTPMWNANFILATTDTAVQESVSNTDEDPFKDREDADESGVGMVIKLFHRSSPVNKLLLGMCYLSRKEAVTFIAPVTRNHSCCFVSYVFILCSLDNIVVKFAPS